MSAADSYQVWTDGACSKNPGEGGWAFVIQQQQKNGKKQEIHKSDLLGIVYHIIDINTKPLFADFLINSFFA